MKKGFSLLVIVCILFGLMPGVVLPVRAASLTLADLDRIDGTTGAYIIRTAEELSVIGSDTANNSLSADYVVARDLVGEQKVTAMIPGIFTGTLIGYNEDSDTEEMRTIEVDIERNTKYAGLFEQLGTQVTIRKIRLTGEINSTSGGYVGGFAGEATGIATGENRLIEDCINDADITSEVERVGGIIGNAYSSGVTTLKNVVNTGTITSGNGSYVGGLVGIMSGNSSISNSANLGNVTANGKAYVGGIAGQIEKATINACYNTGNISASESVGGIVGRAYSANTTIVKNCYNAGKVNSTSINETKGRAAGIIGNISTNARTVENCYNIGEITAVVIAKPIIASESSSTGLDSLVKNNYYLSSDILHDDGYAGTTPKTLEDMKNLSFYESLADGTTNSFIAPSNTTWQFPEINGRLNESGIVIRKVTIAEPSIAEGTVDRSGVFYMRAGDEFSIKITPAENYYINDVLVNYINANLGIKNEEYTFKTTISQDATISVEFQLIPDESELYSVLGESLMVTFDTAESVKNQDGQDGYIVKPGVPCKVILGSVPYFGGWSVQSWGVELDEIKKPALIQKLVNGKFGILFENATGNESARVYAEYERISDGESATAYSHYDDEGES